MAASDPYFTILTSAIRDPKRYKLCLVCGNIVDKEAEECIYCCAYHFETDPEKVSNGALDRATKARQGFLSIANLNKD